MKRFLLVCLFILLPLKAFSAWPSPQGYVNDFAGIIDPSTKSRLESMLDAFEKTSGDEIAVATLPSLEGRTVEDVAVELYKDWGVGKKGKDNGALFLIAPNERKMRIEVGYGLEGAINDALAGRILDNNVVPRFRAGEMSDGIAAGTVAIVQTIAAKNQIAFDTTASYGGLISEAPQKKKGGPLSTAFKILMFLVAAYLFIRHPWLFLLLISGGRGGGGGGGFSGGFGGFGGGMSGGGGASRGW